MRWNINLLKDIFDNATIVIIILVGLFSIFIDGYNLQNRKLRRELNILKVIAFSYISIGIAVFIILKVT
ncbi:MAG: hypothetical protein GX329_01750 [Tissierellia bacterium]|nr:hypothetical protein [Tissierellia bacterium]